MKPRTALICPASRIAVGPVSGDTTSERPDLSLTIIETTYIVFSAGSGNPSTEPNSDRDMGIPSTAGRLTERTAHRATTPDGGKT